jgi:SEC-C motif-containing protein
MQATDPCPCGAGPHFNVCCLPLHTGERLADTAEELMRSRYSAYAVGDLDYVWRTWHPRTRPAEVSPNGVEWTGLEIVDVSDDEVEFRAHYRGEDRRTGTLHERSRCAVRARRWFYLDGDVF